MWAFPEDIPEGQVEMGRIGPFFLLASGRTGHRLQEMSEKGRGLKIPEQGPLTLDFQFRISKSTLLKSAIVRGLPKKQITK